jgi:hypothetical protein
MFATGTIAATAISISTLAFCGAVVITIITIISRHGDAGQ